MGTKATTVRLPNEVGRWVEGQAKVERRALFAQVLYALDVVLEDWEWVLAQDIEHQKQTWKNVIETSENEVHNPDSSNDEDIPVSMRIPLITFNLIAKLALTFQRTSNEQIIYLIKLAIQYWRNCKSVVSGALRKKKPMKSS